MWFFSYYTLFVGIFLFTGIYLGVNFLKISNLNLEDYRLRKQFIYLLLGVVAIFSIFFFRILQ